MIHGRCICSSIILFTCGYYFHFSLLVSAVVLSFPHTNYRPNLASPKTTVPTVYMYSVVHAYRNFIYELHCTLSKDGNYVWAFLVLFQYKWIKFLIPMYTKKQTTKNERHHSLTGKYLNFQKQLGPFIRGKRHVFVS